MNLTFFQYTSPDYSSMIETEHDFHLSFLFLFIRVEILTEVE